MHRGGGRRGYARRANVTCWRRPKARKPRRTTGLAITWMTFFGDPAGNFLALAWRRCRQPGAVVVEVVVDVVAGSSAASGGGITTRSMRKLPPMPRSDT